MNEFDDEYPTVKVPTETVRSILAGAFAAPDEVEADFEDITKIWRRAPRDVVDARIEKINFPIALYLGRSAVVLALVFGAVMMAYGLLGCGGGAVCRPTASIAASPGGPSVGDSTCRAVR